MGNLKSDWRVETYRSERSDTARVFSGEPRQGSAFGQCCGVEDTGRWALPLSLVPHETPDQFYHQPHLETASAFLPSRGRLINKFTANSRRESSPQHPVQWAAFCRLWMDQCLHHSGMW